MTSGSAADVAPGTALGHEYSGKVVESARASETCGPATG